MSSLSLNRAARFFHWPAKTLHLLLSTLFIFGFAYILGRGMFSGSLGGDSGMHVGYAVWLNQYFPSIPHWFPLQGGGVSLLHGYPILPHLLVVIIHRLTDLTILQVFRMISFLGMPLAALGIYLFCWVTLKKQTLGLIAAAFFLLAPVTWTWMYNWGFFSQQVAIVFLPLALIAFDRTFKMQQMSQRNGGRRTWIVVLVVLIALATLCHLIVGAAIAAGMGLFVAAAAALASRGNRMATLGAGLKIIVIGGGTVVSVLAVYIVPFYVYGQIANREGLNNLPPESWHQLPILEFLGLKSIDTTLVLTRMQFPLAVTILAILGGLLIIRRRKRRHQSASFRTIATWALVAVGATIFTLSPWLVIQTQEISPLLVNFFNFRSLLILDMILIPVIAAYGAWGLANELTLAIGKISSRIRRGTKTDFSFQTSGIILASLSSLAIAWVAVVPGPRMFSPTPWMPDYGPNGVDPRDIWRERADDPCFLGTSQGTAAYLCQSGEARENINISEFVLACADTESAGGILPPLCSDKSPSELDVREFLANCQITNPLSLEWTPCEAQANSLLKQLRPAEWPAFLVEGLDSRTDEYELISEMLPDSPGLRIDVSPHLGRLAQDLTVYTDTSQIPPYTNQLSLIHLMWGYQLGEFYVDTYGTPETVNELAKWLGINYAILNPTLDSQVNFESHMWESMPGSENPQILRFTQPLPLASLITRPVILVIGAPENGVYHGLFRLANQGVAPYDEFILVEGDSRVDSYTSRDLELFDAVVLQGYDYKNSERAWNILEDYVATGGSLYVDTGWQFAVPEWEFEQAPNVLPAGQLSWTSYGREEQIVLGHETITADIDVSSISPLIWEQDPWGVSGVNPGSLRDWAEPVLSVQGNPLIVAGEFGQGRVIWSGMNFISHLTAYDNAEERQLLHNILGWLVEGKRGEELAPPVISRDHPDNVDFSTQAVPGDVTWLYWREAYYPDWRGLLIDNGVSSEIPIFRAGPGFMLMPIQSGSQEVTVNLSWQLSAIEKAAYLFSLLGGLLLVGLSIDGLLLSGNGLTWLKLALVTRIPQPFLGEGANINWAERKREELNHYALGATMQQDVHEEASNLSGAEASKAQEDNGHHGVQSKENAMEKLAVDEEQNQLLAAWLEDTGQSDDSWAERVLGKDGTSQDN